MTGRRRAKALLKNLGRIENQLAHIERIPCAERTDMNSTDHFELVCEKKIVMGGLLDLALELVTAGGVK